MKTIFGLQMRLLGVNGEWLHCSYLSHWLCHSISLRFSGDVHEKRGTISLVSTFFGYCASKYAPRFLCGRAHTGMLRLMDVSLWHWQSSWAWQVTSHQSTFCDIMTEQRRKKNINCILRIRQEDSKTCSGIGLAIDCHRPRITLFSLTRLRDSSTVFHSTWGLVDHVSCCSGTRQSYLTLCSGTVSTTLWPWLEAWFPRLHVKLDSHIVDRSLFS
jgi:hypothetical protein